MEVQLPFGMTVREDDIDKGLRTRVGQRLGAGGNEERATVATLKRVERSCRPVALVSASQTMHVCMHLGSQKHAFLLTRNASLSFAKRAGEEAAGAHAAGLPDARARGAERPSLLGGRHDCAPGAGRIPSRTLSRMHSSTAGLSSRFDRPLARRIKLGLHSGSSVAGSA